MKNDRNGFVLALVLTLDENARDSISGMVNKHLQYNLASCFHSTMKMKMRCVEGNPNQIETEVDKRLQLVGIVNNNISTLYQYFL